MSTTHCQWHPEDEVDNARLRAESIVGNDSASENTAFAFPCPCDRLSCSKHVKPTTILVSSKGNILRWHRAARNPQIQPQPTNFNKRIFLCKLCLAQFTVRQILVEYSKQATSGSGSSPAFTSHSIWKKTDGVESISTLSEVALPTLPTERAGLIARHVNTQSQSTAYAPQSSRTPPKLLTISPTAPPNSRTPPNLTAPPSRHAPQPPPATSLTQDLNFLKHSIDKLAETHHISITSSHRDVNIENLKLRSEVVKEKARVKELEGQLEMEIDRCERLIEEGRRMREDLVRIGMIVGKVEGEREPEGV